MPVVLLAVVVALFSPQAHAFRGARETPKQSLAAQVRARGHACEEPLVARKECSDARYRIVLVPNRAARITPIR